MLMMPINSPSVGPLQPSALKVKERDFLRVSFPRVTVLGQCAWLERAGALH